MTMPRAFVVRVVPERFAWAMNLLLVGGLVIAVAGLATLVGQISDVAQAAQPQATVQVSMDTSYALPTQGGRHFYSGTPYVADGQTVTATAVTATVSGVALPDRILLTVAPMLSTIVWLATTWLLVLAVRRLRHGDGFGARVARPVIAATLVLGIGSVVAGIVQGIANVRVIRFAWPAPGEALGAFSRSTIVVIEFGPLLAAAGLLVVALILQRGLALQQETEGLV